jgi:hypothetical protein
MASLLPPTRALAATPGPAATSAETPDEVAA